MSNGTSSPAREPVSLIMTFYNEKASVTRFFDELQRWTRLPEEIVMVDGGSTDGTVELIRARIADAPVAVNVIETGGCNISQGRNIAISAAAHDVIASVDMGCAIAPDWLEQIVAPFQADASVDVVGGYYEASGDHPVQRCFSDLLYKPRLTQENFLPSSRSLAFRRHVWEKVGGYPEDMTVAEDTEFDLRFRRYGFTEVFAPDAKVYWLVKTRYRGYFYQYFRYARSAGYIAQNPKRYLVTTALYAPAASCLVLGAINPWFVLVALAYVVAYVAARIARKERARRNLTPANAWRYAILILTMDIATVLGYWVGLSQYALGRKERWKPPSDR